MRRSLTALAGIFLILCACNKPQEDNSLVASDGIPYPQPYEYDQLPYEPDAATLTPASQESWGTSPQTVGYAESESATTTYPNDQFQGHIHIVQPKDTLCGLARFYYNDVRQWKKIHQANKDKISNPDLIKIGMALRIPQ